MTGWSIRTRLTVWYLAVIVPATIALAIGSWWLARRSLNDEVDRTLTARLDGTREFLESMAREGLHGGEMKEEFGEYVELSRGAVRLEVSDAAGTVLSRPTLPGGRRSPTKPRPPPYPRPRRSIVWSRASRSVWRERRFTPAPPSTARSSRRPRAPVTTRSGDSRGCSADSRRPCSSSPDSAATGSPGARLRPSIA